MIVADVYILHSVSAGLVRCMNIYGVKVIVKQQSAAFWFALSKDLFSSAVNSFAGDVLENIEKTEYSCYTKT